MSKIAIREMIATHTNQPHQWRRLMRPTRSLALLPLLPLLAQAADVTGTWTATFDTAVGKQEYTYELKAEGTQLTGRAKSANGDVAIESGQIAGDKISLVAQ